MNCSLILIIIYFFAYFWDFFFLPLSVKQADELVKQLSELEAQEKAFLEKEKELERMEKVCTTLSDTFFFCCLLVCLTLRSTT